MNIKQLADGFAVCDQITEQDVATLATKGYRSVICNRPDNEGHGQPSFSDIEAATKAAGLQAVYIPIVPGSAGLKEVKAMRSAIETMPGPVLAYCRSGARSSAFFDAVQQGVGA